MDWKLFRDVMTVMVEPEVVAGWILLAMLVCGTV